MSYASIKTFYDPLFCHNHDHGSGSTGYLQEESICTVKEHSLSDLSSNLTEEMVSAEVDPSKINYIEFEPSTSTFGSRDQYGEPLTNQQLTIDFTPIQGVDDDEILLKKCNDFWEFIKKNPKLNKLCAMPRPTHPIADNKESSTVSLKSDDNNKHQALNWIENNAKILGDTFVSKVEKPCEALLGDYKFGVESTAKKGGKALDKSWLRKCDSVVGRRCLMDNTERVIEQFRAPDPSAVEVLKLCQEMEEWDMTHPKKMLSPGHAPGLSHALLQRKP